MCGHFSVSKEKVYLDFFQKIADCKGRAFAKAAPFSRMYE